MKNYTCATCGEGVLLEPQEVEETGPYCMEHLFSEEFPALNQLADEASDTEQRPGHPAKSSQAAYTETSTNEESSVMDQSTGMSAETFQPGDDEYTYEVFTDFDGKVYGGETVKRAATLSIEHGWEDPAEPPAETKLHAYRIFDGGTDPEHQVHALRLIIVDPGGQDVWIDAAPGRMEHIAEWLFRQAAALQPGVSTDD